MGYCMHQRGCDFFIPKRKKKAALDAIKKLATKKGLMGGGSWSNGKQTDQWFAWVQTDEFVKAQTLKDAMAAWRWPVEEDDEGNVTSVYFDGEKAGDDEHLLRAIAPFVKDGSWIEMQGEDEMTWKWKFIQGAMHEKRARIIISYGEEE
jgi:hypothetical protein